MIRLGVKKLSKKGKEYPSEVDYFILDPKVPDPKWREELITQFHKLYGEKPKAIKIMFPPADPDLFFQQWYKRYGKSTLVKCKGDGEFATTTEDFAEGLERTGEDERGFIKVKCLGPECKYQKGKDGKGAECSRMAALQVILPDLKGMGVWQINTGSYNSIVNINSAIDWLKGFCGRFAMIAVTLMRQEQEIPFEGKKTKHYILQVDTQRVSIGEIQKIVATTPIERALIAAPDESKDELFYDNNGKRPVEIPASEKKEEQKEEIEEPELGGEVKSKPINPIHSKELRAEILKGIKGMKNHSECKDYCRTLKEDPMMKELTEEDTIWLRNSVEFHLQSINPNNPKNYQKNKK